MKLLSAVIIASMLCLAACAPEVGSRKWCEQLDAKDKGDWTMDEVRDYARYCLIGNYTDEEDEG